jgi:hypothetical protein
MLAILAVVGNLIEGSAGLEGSTWPKEGVSVEKATQVATLPKRP